MIMRRTPPLLRRLRDINQRLQIERVKNSPKRIIRNEVAKGLSKSGNKAGSTRPVDIRKNETSFKVMTEVMKVRYEEFLSSKTGDNLVNNFKKLIEKVNQAMQTTTQNVEQGLRASMSSLPEQKISFLNLRAEYIEKLKASLSKHGVKRPSYLNSMPFDERWDNIAQSLAVLGRVSTGNKVVPLHDSAVAFQEMWGAVDGAKESALWQTYICKDDTVGRKTVGKLLEAHRRGCETELLYDCGGNISGRWRLTEELKASGASVIAYRPFFRSLFRYLFKGFDWKRSPGLRNHRKILLVDGEKGFCGGLNVGNEYCGEAAGGTGKFRDTHISIEGPGVKHLKEVYDDTKNPQEWKFGLQRWRQIASARLNSTLDDVNACVFEPLQNVTANAKKTGGIYVRKTLDPEGNTTSMKRLDKQRRQLLKMFQKYQPDAFFESVEEAEKKKGGRNGTARVKRDAAFEEFLKKKADYYSQLVKENENQKEGTSPKTFSARERKSLDTYYKTLKELSTLPHKRTYTQVLLQLPLEDTEPVPEATLYSKLRPSATQILSCNPRYNDSSIQYAFWQVTRKCHRRLWITTPYYLPNKKLFKALITAAERGVDVRLLSGSNKTTDPWWMWHASNYVTDRLLRAGVKIYEFKGSQIMHAKTVVVDSIWSSVGSYNWDVMSNRNLEVCLCHLDTGVAQDMESQFLRDLSQSERVTQEAHGKRSYFLRFTSWLFYHGVYILDRITFRAFSNQDLEDTPNMPPQN